MKRTTAIAMIMVGVLLFGGPFVTPARAGAKVDVCHIDEDGFYHMINVSERAKAAHLRHGDGLPGNAIPGTGSFIGDLAIANTSYGFVTLEFEGAGASFGADCTVDGVTGSLSWERENWWSGPIVAVSFLGDGETVDFTVRVDASILVPNLVGCDISLQVTEGGAGLGTWNITAVVDSPGESCIAAGQIQGPWTIESGSIMVEDPI